MKSAKLLCILKILLVLFIYCPWAFASSYNYLDLDEYLDESDKKSISLDFKDAKLNDVLKIFSQQSGMNFIASKEIADLEINLYLDNVPVEDALERILAAHDLQYELSPSSNIFVVKKLDSPKRQLITRVYQLNYATLPSSLLNKTLSKFSTEEETEASAGGSGEGDTEGLIASIKSTLSEFGSIIEDARTNSLIVRDIPSQFDTIEQTIKRLDVRVPQILIEVEMLEIGKNTSDLLGAKFGNTPITFHGATKQDLFPFNLDNIIDDNIPQEDQIPGARDGSFEDPRYETSKISFAGLTFILQFLKTQSDTRSLARPRILTLNNQTAEIKISTDEAIGLESSTTSSEGNSQEVIGAERVNTGVFLTVTPQANVNSGEITLALEPRVVEAKTGSTFGEQTFKDPEERGTKSILRVMDGDTIVVGGLLKDDFDETKTNVPLLGKMPILGAAFRHKDKQTSQSELLIFITPHILDEYSTAMKNSSPNPAALSFREQDHPSARRSEVQKELSYFDR